MHATDPIYSILYILLEPNPYCSGYHAQDLDFAFEVHCLSNHLCHIGNRHLLLL